MANALTFNELMNFLNITINVYEPYLYLTFVMMITFSIIFGVKRLIVWSVKS